VFVWFDAPDPYRRHALRLRPLQIAAEARLARLESVEGFCVPCDKLQRFKVDAGPRYGENVNLREGLICERGLSNRNRLLAAAVLDAVDDPRSVRAAVLERFGPLYVALKERLPLLEGSEYLGPNVQPGERITLHGVNVRHESLERMSYPSRSLDLVVHADVLEHVPATAEALAECHRVLGPGGTMLFTCPFFASRDDIHRLAIRHPDGSIEHLSEPEYHGDPMRPEGVLTFFHFGWALLDLLRSAGFRQAAIGLWYDVFCGFVSNNHPGFDYGNMLPIVIKATR
jgi:SAM-dependent methyltransferase